MIKVKDGYGKLIGTEYKGSAIHVLLSNGGNLGYAIISEAISLVQRNASGQIESSLTTDSSVSPFKITSTVLNTNLNSDLLDGFHAVDLFQNLASDRTTNLTIKIGNTEKKIDKLYATYDSLGNTITAKYVTLDTNLDITGVKDFKTQQKFSVAQGTAPFTVTSTNVVTNLNADLLDGTHKGGLFTDFSNITSGTDANKVSITIGGTTKKIIINYAQNAGSIGGVTADGLFTALTSTPAKNLSITIGGTTKDITSLYSNYWVPQAIGSKDFNTMYGDTYRGTSWYGGGSNTATNNPLGSGSAFGMLVWRNADGYTALLIMGSDGRLYVRVYDGSSWSQLLKFAYATDAGLGGGYWANLPVLATANSGTKPTFAEATATTQVTTPRVHSTGRLTLNATSTGLDLKFNNDAAKSVILNGTAFKPFDAANGNLDLGASNARWKGLYAGTGDFTGIVRTTGNGFYLASTSTYPRSRWTYTSDGIWLLAANWDGNSVKGTLWITGHNADNLTKLNIKSDNTDYNGTLSITSDGRIVATSESYRQAGMYGIYDSTKVGHIWSMGTSFAINANGSNTGNLYGLAYFHTNWSNAPAKNDGSKTDVGPYAGNHQAAWVINGRVCAALGNYVWSRNGFIKHGSSNDYVLLGGGGHTAISTLTPTGYYWANVKVSATSSTTTTPTFALTTATAYIATQNGQILLWGPSREYWLGSNTTSDFYLWGSSSTAHLRLGTNNIERVRVTKDGNVGIGTTSPSYKLHINGTSHSSNYQAGAELYLKAADTTCQTTIFGSNGSGYRMRIIRLSTAADLNTLYSPTLVVSSLDTHAYIAWSYSSDNVWVGGGSGNKWNWRSKLVTSNNYGSYLGYIGTTPVQKSAAAQALTGITRISNSASNVLYLGNANNSSWVLTLNICSHSGASKWAINVNGQAWFSKLMVGIVYNGTGSNYAVNVSGDSHVTGWSRANNGFYVEGTGVHYTHQGTLGEINMINNNEFLWSTSNGSLYFNYRAASRGTTVTNYIWNAGSSGSYASHTLGALTSRGDLALYGLTQTCNKANNAGYMNSALLIREYNFGGSQSDTWAVAPRLSWHWSGRVQTQIGLSSSGDLKLSSDNFVTSYLLLHLGNSSVGNYSVTIGNTAKNFVRDWGHGAANMNAVARGGRSSMGMANLSTPSGGTATAINPNGGTDWHHFINIAYTDGGAGSNSWVTLIANKAGTTDLWVRSRSGGTISDTANWTAGWTRILTGTNYASVLDGRYYTKSESDSRFINAAGDTMTGPLTFANGTWNVVGDDAAIGDYNAAGMLGLKSINNNIPGIGFHNSSNTLLGRLQASGSNLLWNGNKIWHSGNDGSGSGLDADLLDGKHASAFATSGHTHSYLTSGATLSGDNHAAALKTYFTNNKASIPRNSLNTYYSSAMSNGSLYFGYFLSGYDTTPYGGFFVAHYNEAYYVGILNGSFTLKRILTSTNYSSYLGYIGTTAVLKSSAAQALTGITNATLSGKLIFTTAGEAASISFLNGELIDGYGNVLLGTNSASWNVFNSSRSLLITVLKSGNVGIGTTSPSAKLHVAGGTLKITNYNNTMTIGSQNTSWGHIENSANINFYFNRSVHVDGAIWRYNTNYGIDSDGKFHAHTVYANRSGSGTAGGVSLYSNSDPMTYGIASRNTADYGTHGYVTGDWATYLTMSNTSNRGWIFRTSDGTRRLSINAQGHLYANGLVNADRFNSRVATGTQPYACTSTTCNTNLNADMLDGLHWNSFARWYGDASTDSTAKDVTATSTADFFAKIHATSGLFNSRFGAMRGSWWYVGNTLLNTGVGTLEMAGTAVLNLGSYANTNDTYKSLLFLDQGGRLWSYTANEAAVKQWSRYVKTTDVGNGTVTIKLAGATKGSFTMNQSGNTTIELTDNNSTYYVYGKTINGSYKTAYRTQTGRSSGYYISAIRCDTASVAEAPLYGSGIAFGMADTHGYLYMNYSSAYAYIGAGNANKLNWTAALLHSSNSSVSGGGSAGGSSITVKINNTSKTLTIPTSLPANGGTSSNVVVNNSDANSTYRMVWHSGNTLYSTNNIYCNPSADLIYSAGFRHVSYNSASYLLRSDGGAAGFHWSGLGGLPTWLWGGNSQHTYYVYNPSNFNVNSAAVLRGNASNPNNSHPGHGAKVFYSWNTGQANNASSGYSNGITIGSHPNDTAYGFQIVQNMWDDRTYTRRYNGGWLSWKTLAWTSDIPSVGNGTIIINQGGSEKGRFTVNQSGTTTINLTDSNTNTWRGVENVLTSTSTSNSLTANMGRVLANGGSDRPIVLLAGTLYRSGASSSYTTWYFTGYRHRSISSSNPTVYVSGGVARFYFTNASGYGFSFAQVCANHQASGEATGYQSGEYQTRSSGLFWFGTYASGLYLYIRAIALGDRNNDTAESYTGMWKNYSDGVTRVSIIAVGYAW